MDKIINEINNSYKININKWSHNTESTYLLYCDDINCFFSKIITTPIIDKFEYLAGIGVNNILYPLLNNKNKYITEVNGKNIYISNYITTDKMVPEIRANNMYNQLNELHQITSFPRQLTPIDARPKFDEISNQLNAKFQSIELFIRSIENKPLDPYSMPILANYQYILDAKREMVKLQKRIISAIKDHESVNYVFLHNNPKIEHLISKNGNKYLTSIDKGKLGISSLDLAKFYIENDYLKIDFKNIIQNNYNDEISSFYYDYFRFLVLLIYIKKIKTVGHPNICAQCFVDVSNKIVIYFQNFLDKKKEIKEED